MKPDWQTFYASYPRAFGPREYLKQAGHTIGGEPISDEQVSLILARMRALLDLRPEHRLLDLCCGNGYFTRVLAAECREVVGVDFSEPLLEVARRDHNPENVTYVLRDARSVEAASLPGLGSFDRLLMCGALQHFERVELAPLLANLRSLTTEERVLVFLLVPDRRRRWDFYDTLSKRMRHLLRHLAGSERMGTWWHPDDFEAPARGLGLDCSFHEMDPGLHASRYRFDIRMS